MHTRRRLRSAALVLAFVPALACDGGDGGGPVGSAPSLTGHWTGSARLGTVDFVADFVQAGTAVTGTGDFSSPLGGDDFTVTGTVQGDQVALTLLSDELGATTYVGRFVARDRVTGTLDAGSLGDMELTMDRER